MDNFSQQNPQVSPSPSLTSSPGGWFGNDSSKETGHGDSHSKVVVVLTVLFAVILAGSLAATYFIFKRGTGEINLSGNIVKSNETVVTLSAEILKKQIEQIGAIGEYHASRPEVVALIKDNRWQDAVNLAVPAIKESNSAIELIGFVDIDGTAKSSFPASEVVGTNFAFRDWYRGITAQWLPYLSKIYTRSTRPNYNVVAFVTPIRDELGQPLAILLFQVKLDVFQSWIATIKIGQEGKTFIVDQTGKVVAHPSFPPQAKIVDYSGDIDVQKVLSGKFGTEIVIDDNKFISSFVPLIRQRWGVITRIPVKEVRSNSSESESPTSNPLLMIIMASNIVIALAFWLVVRSLLKRDGRY